MRSVLIEELSLIRNGDINLMAAYATPSQLWNEFGGLHKSLGIIDLEFDEIEEVRSEGFKDILVFLGSIEELVVNGVLARDNWF